MKLFSGTPLAPFSDRSRAGTAPGKTAAQSAAPTAAQVAARPATVKATPKPPAAKPAPARPIAAADDSRLRIVPIPRLAAGGRWRVEAMRSLGEPLLLWFTRGQGRITVGGVTRGYGAHNAIFIPAGVMHGFEVGAQSFGTAIFFGQGSTATLPAEPQHLRIREATPQAELSGLIDNIQREMDSTRPGHDRAVDLHLGLLCVWLERQAALAAEEAGRPDSARRLARAYADLLERDFRSGQGVADFARALGVTPTHLTRVCNRTCGRSASDLLHDRVIFEARRMLSETRLPVARISEALGFTSAAYFTRAFQHRTGKTPTDFRRQG